MQTDLSTDNMQRDKHIWSYTEVMHAGCAWDGKQET